MYAHYLDLLHSRLHLMLRLSLMLSVISISTSLYLYLSCPEEYFFCRIGSLHVLVTSLANLIISIIWKNTDTICVCVFEIRIASFRGVRRHQACLSNRICVFDVGSIREVIFRFAQTHKTQDIKNFENSLILSTYVCCPVYTYGVRVLSCGYIFCIFQPIFFVLLNLCIKCIEKNMAFPYITWMLVPS